MLVIHFYVTRAISFKRITQLLAHAFGLVISESAIINIPARAEPLLTAAPIYTIEQ